MCDGLMFASHESKQDALQPAVRLAGMMGCTLTQVGPTSHTLPLVGPRGPCFPRLQLFGNVAGMHLQERCLMQLTARFEARRSAVCCLEINGNTCVHTAADVSFCTCLVLVMYWQAFTILLLSCVHVIKGKSGTVC